MKQFKSRKINRLKGYDYSDCGWYFITICTDNRKCLFGDIIDGQINLNDSGKMIDEILRTLPEHYDDILIDNYIIMPNHVHAIIIKKPVGAAPRGRPLINTELLYLRS
jgi:putative transposase